MANGELGHNVLREVSGLQRLLLREDNFGLIFKFTLRPVYYAGGVVRIRRAIPYVDKAGAVLDRDGTR